MTNETEEWRVRIERQRSEKAGGSKRTFVEVHSTINEEVVPPISAFEKAIKETAEKSVKPGGEKMKRKDLVAIGNIIKGVRSLIPITQKEMADHLGLTITGYANIEQGHAKTTWDTLYKICKKLNLKITIGGTEI